MKVIEKSFELVEISCPSTSETILDMSCDDYNRDASALLGEWTYGSPDEPHIKHPGLKEIWNNFFEDYKSKHDDDYYSDLYETWVAFLKTLDEPGWAAYDLTFQGIACGPISYTILYVVLADTIVKEVFYEDEEDEEWEDEENDDENDVENDEEEKDVEDPELE